MKNPLVVLQHKLIQVALPKFLIAGFLLVAATGASFAQVKNKTGLKNTTNDTPPVMYINKDGNVGIGTPEPQSKLQLGGDLRMEGNSIYFKAGGTSQIYDFIRWSSADTTWGRRDDKVDVAGYRGVRLGDTYDKAFFPVLTVGRGWSFNNKNEQTPAVDIKSTARIGTHPKALALYVTGELNVPGRGVEFRTSDATKGIGFSDNSIYTAGTTAHGLFMNVIGKQSFIIRTNDDERLRIDDDGNIWTNGNGIYFRGGVGDKNQFIKWRKRDSETDDSPVNDRLQIGGWNGVEIGSTRNYANTIFAVDNKGYVGLGVAQPQFPLHIEKVLGNNNRRYIEGASDAKDFIYYATEINRSSRVWGQASVFAMGDIVSHAGLVSTASTTFSDIRLKKDIRASSSAQDLNTIRQLEIVNYKMIDTIADDKLYKKVIAQQVKKVYPLAVGLSFNTLPDVFQKALSVAKIADTTYMLTLRKPHGLKPGDELELKYADAGTITVLVASVQDDKTFTVHSAVALDNQKGVFVYGRKSNDVLTVDYDAISMLNVSATQQLAKVIDQQQQEIALLKERNAKLERENTANKTAISLVMGRLSRLEEGKAATVQPVLNASTNK
jgi:hypothetical protein